MTTRNIARSIPSLHTLEGGGVQIHRAFPIPQLDDIDPFLLMDRMGPIDYRPGDNTGFPGHPHRGFETVTYLLSGQMQHKDSFGNSGMLNPGDVQWMTAGSGLVHSEMPGADLVRTGGRLEGFQLWVNLPRRDKMSPPHYQELKAAQIPEAGSDGVRVKVVAGESQSIRGPIQSRTPILYLHVTLKPSANFTQPLPRTYNAFAYIVGGEVQFHGSSEPQHEDRLVLFSHDGDQVSFTNPGTQPASVLLVAGEPIGEPVARHGPFVMNTRQELVQAFEDYRSGKMGDIA
ncbi:MAG TPA: pirin family protein [Bryobacteraceae bacterium]|nr:pirin family protein [Bryobacteraceae bacterium]